MADDQSMRDEAIKMLPAMAKEELPDGPEHLFEIKVRDDEGEYRFQATLRLHSHWLQPQRR
jgi:hypothetical protein